MMVRSFTINVLSSFIIATNSTKLSRNLPLNYEQRLAKIILQFQCLTFLQITSSIESTFIALTFTTNVILRTKDSFDKVIINYQYTLASTTVTVHCSPTVLIRT